MYGEISLLCYTNGYCYATNKFFSNLLNVTPRTITRLIKENEKLIYSISNYFKNYNSKEDLYQAGCLGLIEAYKRYNPEMNAKFTTYAYPYILGEMRKQVREDKGVKISRVKRERIKTIRRIKK